MPLVIVLGRRPERLDASTHIRVPKLNQSPFKGGRFLHVLHAAVLRAFCTSYLDATRY